MAVLKKIGKEAARIIISLTLLSIILSRIDWKQAITLIKHSNLMWWVAGILLTVAAIIISAYKWKLVLISQGADVPLPRLTSSYFIGLFFNNFLPSSMGGDAYRAYDVSVYTRRSHSAVASVIAERILAAAALACMAGFGFLLGMREVGRFSVYILSLFVFCVSLLIISVNMNKITKVFRRFKRFDGSNTEKKMSEFGDALKAPVRDRRTFFSVILLSVAFQVFVILVNLSVFRALNVAVPTRYFFIFVPVIMAFAMLPVSINGWGVQEGAYVFFFTRIGLSATQAVTGSISFTLTVTLVSMIGVVLLLFHRRTKTREQVIEAVVENL